MADGRAFTSTPDNVSGNAVDITFVTNASAQVVDRQTVAIGSPATIGRAEVIGASASASAADPGLVVHLSPNTVPTVKQGPAGASAWLIAGPVTLATGAATIGAVQLVTGAAVVGALATGAATIGQVQNTTGTATMGLVGLVTGAAVIGALATGTATIGSVVNVTSTATIGVVVLATGSTPIGTLATGTATMGLVGLVTGAAVIGALATGTATLGQVVLATGAAAIGSIATGTATLGYVMPIGGYARTAVVLSFSSVTGVTSEALVTLKIFKGGVEQASGTAYTVTTGKTFRLQTYHGSVIGTGASGNSSKMTIRASSTVSTTSPIAGVLFVHNQAATAAVGGSDTVPIPEGTEIASAQQIGVSHLDSGTANTINFVAIGYEYLP